MPAQSVVVDQDCTQEQVAEPTSWQLRVPQLNTVLFLDDRKKLNGYSKHSTKHRQRR